MERDWKPRARVRARRAFRVADKDMLKLLARWERWTINGTEREYVHDPLAKLIAVSFANFLYGEDPTITAAAEADQDRVDEIVDDSEIPAGLHRAERIIVSEGEAWWKVYTDREVLQVPILDWCSRTFVTPLYRGPRLLACAFVTEVYRELVDEPNPNGQGTQQVEIVWRLAEVHTNLVVKNVLYRGQDGELGDRVLLSKRPETADILPDTEGVWEHGLPMLAGRLVNDVDEDLTLGESDYDAVRDELLALDEAMVIGVENARLTAKKRLFVAGELTDPRGNFDAGADVIQVTPDDGEMGVAATVPVAAVEYTYDSAALIAHKKDLVETILTRVGIVPQIVSGHVEGRAESGTAIRLRFLPTVNAVAGKAREHDAKVPKILSLLLQVDALPEAQGGFATSYSNLEEPPVFERGEPLPTDEGEVIADNSTAVTALIRSRERAVREQWPQWTDTQVNAELDLIDKDEKALMPPPPSPPGGETAPIVDVKAPEVIPPVAA